MNSIDLAVIVVYVAGCTALGAWIGSGVTGLKGYFLGERSIPAWAVMISIVATETSTATFLSVPGLAYKAGGDFTFLQLALGYLLGRVVVAMLLLPSYFKGEIYTAYQVLNDRFGGATKTTASLMFLVTRTLGDGLRLFLAALAFQKMAGLGIGPAIVIMGLATILYTYLGGLRAVVWTDVIQFAVYLVGAVAALAILAGRVEGGLAGVIEYGRLANKFRLFDFSTDPSKPFTFWAGLIGGLFLNTATHGADQLMVQRYLAARSQRQAAWALIASGFVVLAQFALFLLIGVGLWAFFEHHGPVDLRADEEFIHFIRHNLPVGLLGLVMAAIFSAAMSTLSSSLNASASAVVNDLYRPLAPAADERRLLRVSKGLTAVFGVLQMAVAYGATRLQDNVVISALAIASFVTGIVLGLFLLGVLTRRVGQRAALWGLVVGLLVVSYVAFGPSLPRALGPYLPAPLVVQEPADPAGDPAATVPTARPLYPFPKAIASPWYALIGSTTVFGVGLLASLLWPAGARPKDPTLADPP